MVETGYSLISKSSALFSWLSKIICSHKRYHYLCQFLIYIWFNIIEFSLESFIELSGSSLANIASLLWINKLMKVYLILFKTSRVHEKCINAAVWELRVQVPCPCASGLVRTSRVQSRERGRQWIQLRHFWCSNHHCTYQRMRVYYGWVCNYLYTSCICDCVWVSLNKSNYCNALRDDFAKTSSIFCNYTHKSEWLYL